MQQSTGVVPPPMPPMSMDQQPHQQQPQFPPAPPPQQQQWTMMPQQHLQQRYPSQPQTMQPPPMMWNQQPPPAAMPPPQQMHIQAPQPQVQPQFSQTYGEGSDEIRSLWIGDLQYWMDENYVMNCFSHSGEVLSVKIIRNKQTGQSEGYGFIEFLTRAAAERALQTYNGALMPNVEHNFRLNWATFGAGERRSDDTPDYTIFVGDLASDVTDYVLHETFRGHYQSVKGAKVVIDRSTGRSKGYGFVRFGDETEQLSAMTEMNGMLCSTRPMRIGAAATKKAAGTQQYTKDSYQSFQGNPGETDPNNTTIFVGGLDPSVSDEHLRQMFGQFGELVHVKIPVGKRCGFVQFTNRPSAEQALSILNGTLLGGQNIRLSWGRSPSSKQADQSQWNGEGGGYYGYSQGYDAAAAYGYGAAAAVPPPQDPNMYYGGYPGYGNYQQPPQQ